MHARLNRRELLVLLGTAAVHRARAAEQLLHPTRIDHVSLAVRDIDQAMIFYRTLFGSEVMKDNKTARRFMRFGPCYLSIAPAAAGQAIRIDHACAGVKDLEAVAGLKTAAEKEGLPLKGSSRDFTISDPDGTNIQVSPNNSWPQMPNATPEPGRAGEPMFRVRGMHHLAIRVADMERSTAFYRKLFGPEVRHQGNPPQPWFQAGETIIGLYYPTAGKPDIDHFCALVDPFDAPAAVKKLKDLGAKAELSRTGGLAEFYDPQGIRLQVWTTTQSPSQ